MLLITISIYLCCLPRSNAAPTDMHTAPVTTLQNCQRKCGDLTIPYPFGIGTDCSMSANHNIICHTSSNPPKAFLASKRNIEIVSISETQVKIRNFLTFKCYDSHGFTTSSANGTFDLVNTPFTISAKANKYTTIGCDDISMMDAEGAGNLSALGGCITWCYREKDLVNGTCSGLGCCQTIIPNGLWNFTSYLWYITNHTEVWSFNPCSYAFLAEENSFRFTVKELADPGFINRTVLQNLPVVLEWTVGDGARCSQAEKLDTYACKENSKCLDSTNGRGGYKCHCLPGYEGNPYLGCTDVDECAGLDNPCSGICTNTLGNYECSCPTGQHGDGLKNGTGCTARSSQFATKTGIGVSIGLLLAFLCTSGIYFRRRKQRLAKLKQEFFKRNGGLLLVQHISLNQTATDSTRIFSAEELELATKSYSEERIIGAGGNGTVYKGILYDNRVVAIKKSKIVDQTQIQQFINEVIILTQINHRNVVKLLGCCLETEVPLLVYEYISNGTLLDHLHNNIHASSSWLTWGNCVRIASETADALAYLHSAVNMPIIHRDVKSANILINECYTARISDFGASRLIPIDKSQVSTLVQGTLGYLDPEYFHTGQLTEKSDVYSFGVVLAELLTRQKPISMERMDGHNLAALFSTAVEKNWVSEIVHSQLIKQCNQEQLDFMTRIVKGCLNVKREDRPSMKEVAVKLDELMKKIRHPWASGDDRGVMTDMSICQTRGNAALLLEQHSMQRELITEMGPR